MKILITGDSWGRGEWGHNDQGVYSNTHPGLQAFLEEDGHTVVNVSKAGGHNYDAYINMMSVLKKTSVDLILWLKADPLRDLMPEDYDPIKHDFSTYSELKNESDRQASIAYKNFASIGQQVYCLGGGGKLNLDAMQSFQNLIPLIPSITELVLDDYTHPELWASDWIFLIDKQFDIPSIDKILENKRRQDLLGSHPIYRNYFWPDGDHPNRRGWKVVYDYIKPLLNL